MRSLHWEERCESEINNMHACLAAALLLDPVLEKIYRPKGAESVVGRSYDGSYAILECSRKHAEQNATLGTGRAANRCQTQPALFPRQPLGNELRGTVHPTQTHMDVTFLCRF